MDTTLAVGFFGALFAIMNPITNLPVFLSVTDGLSVSDQRKVAVKTSLYCLILGSAFAAIGSQALGLFGISVDDLRVAGGLVVLMIGLNMLNGGESSSHHGTESEKQSYPAPETVAFYPLAFPILVGPGTITTLILYAHHISGAADAIAFAVVFLGVVFLLLATFWNASTIAQRLSENARVIMSRFMGMILSAIAISMIADGLKALLPGLA
ncbi:MULTISPECIES: MarC family protein [Alphaproteobacteria]|uniref:MarC family protein n=1 Tax=Alphaproteobacteria TaxID=28211 RepID=UPI0012BD3200|nr:MULTISPECIES: MarC family protein [Alphaproteobacteria]MTI03734.1 MarC family protein [Roseibium sp. RKSG952]